MAPWCMAAVQPQHKKWKNSQSELIFLVSFGVFLEFKKFLQRKSNSMYNFEQPVIMKVCMKQHLVIKMYQQRTLVSWPELSSVLRPSSTCSSWSWSGHSTAPRPRLRGSTNSWDSCWTTVRSWRPCRSIHNAPRTSSSGPCRRSARTRRTFGLSVVCFLLQRCEKITGKILNWSGETTQNVE